MATETSAPCSRGRHRTLRVKTWLGAGALTLGVGAALAGAAGIAQADTGSHQSTPSASSTKADPGPKRTPGVASTKRVTAPTAKVTKSPVSTVANAKPAAGAKATAAAAPGDPQFSQTINTPFGPIKLEGSVTAPPAGESGDVEVKVVAKTPLGGARFELTGNQTFVTTPEPTSTTALTGGKLVVPPVLAFAASTAGAFIGAGITAADSLQTFLTAVNNRNIGGAFLAWAEAAPRFTNALLFGTRTIDLPLQQGGMGPDITVHIPVGGFFSPARSVTADWDAYSTTQAGVTVKLAAGDIVFAGTKFGGAAPAFFKIFGL